MPSAPPQLWLNLARTNRLLAEGNKCIARQLAVIEDLERDRCDQAVAVAQGLLDTLKQVQLVHEAHQGASFGDFAANRRSESFPSAGHILRQVHRIDAAVKNGLRHAARAALE
jgi:hypothetical protein